MTSGSTTTRTVLERLESIPPPQRRAFLEQSGDVEELLLALGDEAERLVVVEVARALRTADLVVALSDQIGLPAARSRARRARGQALAYAGRHDAALLACREAADVAERAGESIQAARARLASIHPLSELGRYDDALRAGESARRILIEHGQPALAARADINLGVVHRKCGRPERALTHFDRALEPLRDEPVILAQLQSNRGEALLELDRLPEARDAFELALRAFQDTANHWGAAIVEGNLADLAAKQGRFDRALYHFESARSHVERDQSPTHYARLLLEQADAKGILGMWAEAADDYVEAAGILERSEQSADLARACAGLGRAWMNLNRFQTAAESLDRAASIYGRLVNQVAHARVDLLRSDLALRRGEIDRAASFVRSALATFRADSIDRALALHRLARIESDGQSVDSALAHVDEALRIAEMHGIVPLIADLLLLRGRCHSATGSPANALDDYRTAVNRLEQIRGTLQADRFRAAFLGERLAAYTCLTTALLDVNDEPARAEAFDVMERARSRSLLDAMGGSMSLGDFTSPEDENDPLFERIDACRARLNVLYSRIGSAKLDGGERGVEPETRAEDQFQQRTSASSSDVAPSSVPEAGPVAPVPPSWRVEADALERELFALETRSAARARAGRGVAELFANPVTLERLQEQLDDDTCLIEYFSEGITLSAFVITARSVGLRRRFVSEHDVADLVRRFHFQIGRAQRPGALSGERAGRFQDDALAVCRELYDAVIRPIEKEIADCARLVIAAAGPLHALPFAAVCDGRSARGFLIERASVISTPSASVYSRLLDDDGDAAAAGRRALVVGLADEHAPRIQDEADTIAAMFREPKVLTGAAATADRVMSALGEADLAHLACHGRFDPRNALASGLRLADRWMTVRDIYRLHLPGSMVALSGCETGMSEIGRGNELIGLVRAFLAAGASCLAVSLWRVNDEITTKLMLRFYRAAYSTDTGEALSPAAAMRRAQLETLVEHPHPALWAPFILIGRS